MIKPPASSFERTMTRTIDGLMAFLSGKGWTSLHEIRAAGWGSDHEKKGSARAELIGLVRQAEQTGLIETMGGDKGTFMIRPANAAPKRST